MYWLYLVSNAHVNTSRTTILAKLSLFFSALFTYKDINTKEKLFQYIFLKYICPSHIKCCLTSIKLNFDSVNIQVLVI